MVKIAIAQEKQMREKSKLEKLFERPVIVNKEIKPKVLLPRFNDRNKDFIAYLAEEFEDSLSVQDLKWFREAVRKLNGRSIVDAFTKNRINKNFNHIKLIDWIKERCKPFSKMGAIAHDVVGVNPNAMSLYLTIALIRYYRRK